MNMRKDFPHKIEGLSEKDLGDAVVVISKDGENLHTFENTGLLLWKSIDGRKTVDELVKILMEEYEVSEDLAQMDTQAFLQTLKNSGLVIF